MNRSSFTKRTIFTSAKFVKNIYKGLIFGSAFGIGVAGCIIYYIQNNNDDKMIYKIIYKCLKLQTGFLKGIIAGGMNMCYFAITCSNNCRT